MDMSANSQISPSGMIGIEKPNLRIAFEAFWAPDNVIFDHYFRSTHFFLFQKYNIIIDRENPDVIFRSVFQNRSGVFPKQKVPTILLNHEPLHPSSSSLQENDYVIGFDYEEGYPKNYVRIPYMAYRVNDIYHYLFEGLDSFKDFIYNNLTGGRTKEEVDALCNNKTGFCSYIQTKPVAYRIELYNALETYKHIDSGGKHLFNLTGEEAVLMQTHLEGKESLLQKYSFMTTRKFGFALENTPDFFPGYVTEKIVDAYFAGTVPIYAGSPLFFDSLNSKAFLDYIRLPGEANAFVNLVKYYDMSSYAYKDILHQPLFRNYQEKYYPDAMLRMYERMIEGTW